MVISYVKYNSRIKEKQIYFNKIAEYFNENKECENNVRNFEKEENSNVIQFSRRAQK